MKILSYSFDILPKGSVYYKSMQADTGTYILLFLLLHSGSMLYTIYCFNQLALSTSQQSWVNELA